MSGAQTSTFGDPNILYKSLSGLGTVEVQQAQNQLLQQQQDISGHEIEMGARLAGTLLSAYDTPEARAAVYPTLLAQARAVAPGYFKNAPAVYPGDESTKALARLGTPSADLFRLGVDRQAKGAIAPGDGGTTATGGTGGGGGGTGTAGGADTAPVNAAGDSRTRKAAEGGPPASGSPGAAVAKQVHDFWISKGFSEEQTAGIMAGGPGSESDFTPTVFGDKGTSYGLYQHHGPRLDAMRQFFGLSGSQNPTADQQNQYAHWEITQGPLKHVGEMLKNAKTPAEAAAIWTQYFGVPADKSEIGRRAAGAQRFVGLYGGQPGAPGSPQTPPSVMMGQVGDQTVPPPPGGVPGAYPAIGGGMGAVIGRPTAVGGTPIPAGRPTGPPVITDQPAGGGVVAGPPGTAVVGAPQPPGPAVAGNVAAINKGIVARGGQPVTDPTGAHLGDIGYAIQTFAEAERCSVVRDFCGHGLGRVFHDHPNVLHYGRMGEGVELKEGMFFTIEPMINLGRPHVKVLSDGWTAVTRDRSLSAQFEHTIGVTKEGCEIFTLSPRGLYCPPYKI